MKYSILTPIALFFFLAVTGCSIIGGGVAGASYDPIWRGWSVGRYHTTIATNFTECLVADDGSPRPEQRDDLMRTFTAEIQSVGDVFVTVPNSSFIARYRRNTFELLQEGNTVIKERLPAMFDMHPVCLGLGKLSGVPVVMVVNPSRGTSGRYFVGLYTQDGNVLYRSVLRAYEVWDVRATENAVDIIGSQTTKRLAFKVAGNDQKFDAGDRPAVMRKQGVGDISLDAAPKSRLMGGGLECKK